MTRNWQGLFSRGLVYDETFIDYMEQIEAILATIGPSGVASVAAEDASIVVDGTASDPTIRTGTLDAIATAHPPVGGVAMNSQKLTGLAAGTTNGDSVRYEQIPTALPPSGSAGGVLSGTYPSPGMASGAAAANLGSAGGDLTGTYPNPTLATAGGGAAGPTGSATVTPIVTVDAKGRVTALSSATTVPTNAAGGDLTGNYPNPTLAAAGGGAAGPIGSATVAPVVTVDAKGRVTALSQATITHPAAGLAVFGDGSDGALTFDGTTTLLGIVPSPNSAVNGVYTLARDIFLADGSALNSGISIITNGFRIFCQGTFTNNGTIKWNGNNGAAQTTAGTAVFNTSASINTGSTTTSPGTAGGAGGTTNGVAGTAYSSTLTLGGIGGSGGDGTSGTGGGQGAGVALTSVRTPPRAGWWASHGTAVTTTLLTAFGGGQGGGGGGGDGTQGGGGGSGGAIVIMSVKAFAGTGAIQARGGNGGTPTAGARGGGGGGGGGVVIIVSSSVSSGAITGQTIDANGGTKGSPHGAGTDNATNGNNGLVILLPN